MFERCVLMMEAARISKTTAQYPRRLSSKYVPPLKPEISQAISQPVYVASFIVRETSVRFEFENCNKGVL
jgi:hypothetical protein